MEITKTNFTETFDDIADAVNQATFLSLDGEFTGLEKPDLSHICPFDTTKDRYLKLLEGSLDFLLIQFGLCAYKFKEETQSYEARPFNFYIFPRPYTRQAPDRRFLCQSSSIEFLVQQGFDFNKVFREGIPYLTPSQEDAMREALSCKHQAFSKFSSPTFVSPDGADMGPGKGPVQIPDEQKDFVASVCEQVSNYLDEAGEQDPLQLAPCNGFQRKLIYQTVRSKFSSIHLETKTGEKKERFIVVTKVSNDEELKKKEKDKQNAEIMELEEAVGFSKVMKLISLSGKLVVGHNMLLDVMHVLNQFCCPLPADLDEFKSMVRGCFPRLLDTKFMASTHPFRDIIPNTALANLQEALEKDPFTPAVVELAEGFERYRNATDMYHEAGYDAFITGCMFATMTNYIGNLNKEATRPAVEPTEALLQPFLNKLFLMRIADIPYLNLAGPDVQPNRDHVFHITFPKEWRSSDINNLFGPYGNIHISWLNDTSAFVALYKKDNANVVTKALTQSRSTYQLLPYNRYKSLQEGPMPVKRAAPFSADDADTTRKRQRNDAAPMATPEDEEIPEVVPRTNVPFEDSARNAGATDTPQKMFTEPEDW